MTSRRVRERAFLKWQSGRANNPARELIVAARIKKILLIYYANCPTSLARPHAEKRDLFSTSARFAFSFPVRFAFSFYGGLGRSIFDGVILCAAVTAVWCRFASWRTSGYLLKNDPMRCRLACDGGNDGGGGGSSVCVFFLSIST